jgi:hypothetical protein
MTYLTCLIPRYFGSHVLYKDIRDSEICPRGYVLHRKDRTNKTGGGVLLAIKNEYNSEHVPELDTDCEIVWAKMNLGMVSVLSTFPGLLVSTKSSVFVRCVGWSIS